MRDHPAHTAPMMGGMWGARVAGDRDRVKARIVQGITQLKPLNRQDRELLHRQILLGSRYIISFYYKYLLENAKYLALISDTPLSETLILCLR